MASLALLDETLDQRYQLAVAFVGKARQLSNDQRLRAYGLFKQAAAGDCAGSRPFLFDPVGCAKYDAWQETYTSWKSANPEKAKMLQDAIDGIFKAMATLTSFLRAISTFVVDVKHVIEDMIQVVFV